MGPEPESGLVTACTVVARNYLPAARVLARSYRAHHPEHEFVIAIIDAGPNPEQVSEARVIGPAEFGVDEQDYLRMATAYNVTELATAVKPYVLRELRREGAEVAIFLDPDIMVFAPMPEVAELALAHQLVLTPHFTEPLPRDGFEPDEAVIMGTGVFNLGFIATGPGSEPFLDFWAERLRHDAIVAPEQQLFTDQRWVDQVPALFGHTVLRDPGFNVAYWNLHERQLGRVADGSITAGGSSLRFFHFSGYRPEKPWLLSFHCARNPRVLLSDHSLLRELCDGYGAALREAGYAETLDAIPYGFAKFPDGAPLTAAARRVFRTGWVAAEGPSNGVRGQPEIPPHAFGMDGGQALREWLTAPADQAEASAGLHRLAMAAWHARTDLQLAFPHPTGADAAGFRHWCGVSGVSEGMLPSWAVPGEPPRLRPPEDVFGVNIAGYLTAELGLGEMGRIVHEAIRQAEVDTVSVVEERSLSNRTGMAHDGVTGHPRFPVSLLAVNADQTPVILANYPELAHERYTIGLWAWELDEFPEWQHSAFALVDEVWTVSDFCRDAIAAVSPVPVKTIPVPVRDPGEPTPRGRRPGEPVRFLFAFDFNSVGERKYPWGLVEAFQRAFGTPGSSACRSDVSLMIKAINGDKNPHDAERLRVLAAADDRVELVERYLSPAELHELYSSSDCYVSLHRSEGFGLTVAEAMARALPVISTDYSSTTEFFDASSGWPIRYWMTDVGGGKYPYHADAMWADPDLDAAAAAMREVADDPAEAQRRGLAAREHVLRTRSMDAASEWMAAELQRAYRSWQANRPAASKEPSPVDPLDPLRASRLALYRRPDSAAPSRLPGAPALRKAMLRVIDHYDVHQRDVQSELTDGVEQSAALLLARIEGLEARLAAQEAELADRVQTEVERVAGPVTRRAASAMKELNALDDQLDRLRQDAAASADLEKLTDRFHDHESWTREMFMSRDARVDNDEQAIQTMLRELGAVHDAARMLHAPLPVGADVVLCDAGALLMPKDTVVWGWITYHRSWEPAEAVLLHQLMVRRPGAFLDVGAHVGYHTLRLLQSCPQVAKVVAVEVDPVNFEYLERNIAANLPASVARRIHALQLAAWDADCMVELVHADVGNSGDHRVQAVANAQERTETPAVRLDHTPEVLAESVTVVKLDLQGRDHRALVGLTEVLRRDRPDVVCEFCPEAIEELGDDPLATLDLYRRLGYEPVVVAETGPTDRSTDDKELVRLARAEKSGFLTLWLRPS